MGLAEGIINDSGHVEYFSEDDDVDLGEAAKVAEPGPPPPVDIQSRSFVTGKVAPHNFMSC